MPASRLRRAWVPACLPACTIGAALLQPSDTMETIVERADAALYLAKHSGRNRVAKEKDLQRQHAGKVESMAS